jgi:alanine dehydrogenase
MLLLREDDVVRLLPMREAIRVVGESFAPLAAGAALNQPRRRLVLPTGAVLHALAGAWGNYFGTKVYATHPRHGAHFLVMLYEAATARPLALIEANRLGQIRTGAATGVATGLLARHDAATLGVIGSGFQARTQVEAVGHARNLREVRVWSRNAERRERFAAECGRDFGLTVRATATAEECVRDAAILVTATYAREPVLDSACVAAGAHVNAVGSNDARRRELPPELIARASLIAVDSVEQARLESGDLLLAWTEDEWRSSRLVELHAVVAGAAGRRDTAGITIFKSNGLGVEDVAAAAFVYERALESGAGTPL